MIGTTIAVVIHGFEAAVPWRGGGVLIETVPGTAEVQIRSDLYCGGGVMGLVSGQI